MGAKQDAYPKSYAEAMTCPDAQQYHEAAVKKMESLIENGTFVPCTLPPQSRGILLGVPDQTPLKW